MTIYPYILWSRKKRGWEDRGFVAHEMYHWREQKTWKENHTFGLFRWLIKYCFYWAWYNLLLGLEPKHHPMEKSAYEEHDRVVRELHG